MNCPSCGSNKMKTLPVIYGSGTTDRSSISFSRRSVRTGSGRRQTKLAASASPPRGPSLILSLVGLFIVFLLAKWANGKVLGCVCSVEACGNEDAHCSRARASAIIEPDASEHDGCGCDRRRRSHP